jgi:uncharacterized protein YbgA (DUF1722 family)/uncharacterized protein YbbK (DUF523 family)
MEKIRIGISSCLLGEKVRYDGGHKWDRFVTDTLGKHFEWTPVCPEVEYGLPVPREPMHLEGDPASPRLITTKSRKDHTEGMGRWVAAKLRELDDLALCGFIFKSRSPSSGIGGVTVYTTEGMPSRKGAGLFGGAFVKYFPHVPVIDDGRLHDPALRENFIERVFVCKRWRVLTAQRATVRNLMDFHTVHKLLIMSHSQKHLAMLGRLVAAAKKYTRGQLYSEYVEVLTEGLKLTSTVKKNTNVLLHIAGYFKRRLEREDKLELSDLIEEYHIGRAPLIAPLVLINHYVRKFDDPYLKHQNYLHPHPLELMLRNHA